MKSCFLKCLGGFAGAFVLSACVTPRAEFQTKVYQPKKKGTIRYSLRPLLFQSDAVGQRRMDAQSKMENFCQPEKPVIVSERKQEKEVGYYSRSSHSGTGHSGTSYHNYSTGAPIVRPNVTTGAVNTHSHVGGSSSTYSAPDIIHYNIVNFECR